MFANLKITSGSFKTHPEETLFEEKQNNYQMRRVKDHVMKSLCFKLFCNGFPLESFYEATVKLERQVHQSDNG